MPEEKKEVETTEEKKTPDQSASADEKKSADQEEETSKKTQEGEEQAEEWTPPTKEQWEKVQKKAQDFDGIIEKKRLEKLSKKEAKPEEKSGEESEEDKAKQTAEEIIENARKVAEQTALEILGKARKEDYETNLAGAYKDFLKENPWADSDEVISNISKNFNPTGIVKKEDLLAKLEIAAQHTYPAEYKKVYQDRIRAEILAEESLINAGEGGGAGAKGKGPAPKYTPEQAEMARRSGNNPDEVYK